MQNRGVPDEVEALKKQLDEAKTEIERLKLQLSNVTLLLRKEMNVSESLPKVRHPSTNQADWPRVK